VTGLDGVPQHPLLVQAKVKKVFQGIEPAVDCRPGAAVVMLVLYKLVDLAKGYLREGDRHLRKKQAQIRRITRDAMPRELPALQVQPKPIKSSLANVIHALPPLKALALLHLRHRLVVLRTFRPVIQLRIAERDVEGAMPHQLFDHLQRCPGIEQLGGKGMPVISCTR
jgi:hypothetical protein